MNSTNSLVLSRRRRRRTVKGPARLVAVLVAVALVASLSACGGEPVEYFTPAPASPTPDVVVSDEPEAFERPDVRLIHPPQKPDVMLDLSEESALAFAHYFVDVLNYTANSGDTTILEEISGPECRYCQGFIETTNDLEASSQWIEGYELSFSKEPTISKTNGLVYAFQVDVQSSTYQVKSTEELHGTRETRDLVGGLVIYRLGEYWLVEDFGKNVN